MSVADELRERTQKVVDATAASVVRIGRHGGRGCGIVVGPGVVVTNAHNLRDRTTEVTFADGRAVQGRALGIDLDGDLAALEVDTADAPALEWAEAPAQLGAPVFAVARITEGVRVTVGTVSAVGRVFRGPRGRRISDGIEHTAPLARGSSGGPIVDESGRLLGISTLRLGDGFSIALPATPDLSARINDLREGQGPQRQILGVGLAPAHITRRLRRSVGLPDRDGVLVRMVEPGSPAERAGLQRGDLITSAGDTSITSADDVASAIDAVPADGSLALHVVRGAEELDIVVSFAAGGSASETSDHGEA